MSDDGLWGYRARVVRAIDADTWRVEADLGFGARMEVDVRLAGIDAPERGTRAGNEATAAVGALLAAHGALGPGTGWPLRMRTEKTAAGAEARSFARWVAAVRFADDGSDPAAALVAAGHAVPWAGPGPATDTKEATA